MTDQGSRDDAEQHAQGLNMHDAQRIGFAEGSPW